MPSVKLPVRIQQEVKCYTQFALPLCVVFTEKKYHSWVLKNFMRIKSSKEISKNGNHLQYVIDDAMDNNLMRVDYSDVLSVVSASWGATSDHAKSVKSELENGFYVHYQFDEFYLREKSSYNNFHFLHPSLVYGYSDSKQEFYAIGFVGATFKEFVIGFDEFDLASKNRNLFECEESSNSHRNRNIYCYKLKSANQNHPFNIVDLKNNLQEYLESPEIDGWIYGLGGYNIVLKNLVAPYEPGCYLKYNTTHLLYEHKKIISLAIEYACSQESVLNKFSHLIAEYNQVIRKIEVVRSLHMEEIVSEGKTMFVSTEASAKKIHGKLIEVYATEISLVKRILNAINLLH